MMETKYKWVAVGLLKDNVTLKTDLLHPDYSHYGENGIEEKIIMHAGEMVDKSRLVNMYNVRIREEDSHKLELDTTYNHPEQERMGYKSMSSIISRFYDKAVNSIYDGEDIEQLTTIIYTNIVSNRIKDMVRIIGGPDIDKEYLKSHSLHVGILNGLMGHWMRYDNIKIRELITVGLLHDIGKLKVPSNIINKTGSLNEEEFKEAKRHVEYGVELLKESEINLNHNILKGISTHHERAYGSGYPIGMGYMDIGAYGRITGITDVFDAITTDKAYRKAESIFRVMNLYRGKGFEGFDINMVTVFLQNMSLALEDQLVLMSDKSCRTVVFLNEHNYEFPLVQLNDEITNTDENMFIRSLV